MIPSPSVGKREPSYALGTKVPGGYTLSRFLGRGGFAEVYEGTAANGEVVAVKLLTDERPRSYLRFQREIKVTRALPEARHLVGYRGHGTQTNGRPFLALEFVGGYTLSELLGSGLKPDTRGACRLVMQLCEAFGHLHHLGLTHGDIKPGNIMIHTDGKTAVLLDFGLVRDAQGLLKLMEEESLIEGDEFKDDLDQGILMGTPEYMAPEQISDAYLRSADWGNRQTDTPADVFGLGVIFYQLLSQGRKPIPFNRRGKDYVKESVTYLESRLAWTDDNLQPIADIDYELWTIVHKALRQDPKMRQGDARILGADIDRYLQLGVGVEDDADETRALESSALRAMLQDATSRVMAAKQEDPTKQFDVLLTPPGHEPVKAQPPGKTRLRDSPWAWVMAATTAGWLLVAGVLWAVGIL